LVVVHRRLLRKFASVELEIVESKKKIILRDDRIKQLETSGRSLVGNMKQQSERHLQELVYLREQIQVDDFKHSYFEYLTSNFGLDDSN
jgi:kinesin family protein 5